jgi:hypothetical protein
MINRRYQQIERLSVGPSNKRVIGAKMRKRVLLCLLFFSVLWLPDLLGHIAQNLNYTPLWISYIQCALAPLQGFVNFFIYGIPMSRKRVAVTEMSQPFLSSAAAEN